jgi:hypothetical protein
MLKLILKHKKKNLVILFILILYKIIWWILYSFEKKNNFFFGVKFMYSAKQEEHLLAYFLFSFFGWFLYIYLFIIGIKEMWMSRVGSDAAQYKNRTAYSCFYLYNCSC